MMYTCLINTPIGEIRAAAENEVLTGLWFTGQKYYPAQADIWVNNQDEPVFESLRGWISDYFAGKCSGQVMELNPGGDGFSESCVGGPFVHSLRTGHHLW